jgi:hypothetical protein
LWLLPSACLPTWPNIRSNCRTHKSIVMNFDNCNFTKFVDKFHFELKSEKNTSNCYIWSVNAFLYTAVFKSRVT